MIPTTTLKETDVPLYSYRCVQCDAETITTYRGDELVRICRICGNRKHRRVWSVSFQRSMPPHFNQTVGKYITNQRQFRDELKRSSEQYSLRTGIDADFRPIDRDPSSLGVTEEGLTGKAAEWAAKGDGKGAYPKPPELPKTLTRDMVERARAAEREAKRRAEAGLSEPEFEPNAPEPTLPDAI